MVTIQAVVAATATATATATSTMAAAARVCLGNLADATEDYEEVEQLLYVKSIVAIFAILWVYLGKEG